MPWHTIVHADVSLIETCYVGVLTPMELSTAVEETLNLVRSEKKYRLLADCMTLEGGHSLFDLYAVANMLWSSGLGHKLKEAILLPSLPEAVEAVKFWELTCVNRGVRVQLFTERQSAIEWLLN